MCACRCGIRVHLKDGALRYIDGNPEHPLNKGVICAKGASGIMKQVSPARLTRPLKRREGAERGAGAFEAISWDEAFSILERRLAAIRASDPVNHDNKRVLGQQHRRNAILNRVDLEVRN
jgi:anaerobic selenocysteine-containing dehydrogenase